MLNPSDESFFASKTMVLICLGIGAIVLLVVLAVAVKVIWHQDVFQLVSSGILGISAHTGAGTARNTIVDGPTRAANAAAATGFTPATLQAATPPPPMSLGAPPTP